MKTETKTIGGFTYRMAQLGGMSGKDIALILAKPFAALLEGAASKGLRGATKESLLEAAVGSGAVSKAIALLSKEDFQVVCDAFAAKTTVTLPDGKTKPKTYPLTDVFDDHFAGRYGDLFAWFAWGVNMNGFFDAVLRAKSEAAAASASGSPPASTGGDGDSSPGPIV